MVLELRNAALVLADISGYTSYIKEHTRSALHAEQVITDLLESIVSAAEFPLKISKFEGDAAFMYAAIPDGTPPQAVLRDVTAQINAFFSAFKAKQGQLMHVTVCQCDACRNIINLKLKAVLHYGEVVFKQIRQFEELGGEAVILIHRLLKNTVPAREYVLMTEAYLTAGGGMAERNPERRTEKAEGIGDVVVYAYYSSSGVPETLTPASTPATLPQKVQRAARLSFHEIARALGLRRKPRMGTQSSTPGELPLTHNPENSVDDKDKG